VLLQTIVFIYFKKYSDTEQSLTYPSEKLVETDGASVTLMESVMTGDTLEFSGAASQLPLRTTLSLKD
jgi:hypothetical protein